MGLSQHKVWFDEDIFHSHIQLFWVMSRKLRGSDGCVKTTAVVEKDSNFPRERRETCHRQELLD